MRNGDVSFWYADLGGLPAPRTVLPGDLDTDICIIGAGFTGLWTAYYLKRAQPDLRVTVIEAEFAGYGASGRNGGWCSGEFSWSRARYQASSSRAGVQALERALQASVEEIIAVTQREGIQADIIRTPTLTYACSPAQMQRLRAERDEALAWGNPALELLEADAARARIDIAGAQGALLRHGTARIQPAKLVRGLAEVVERLGVTIHEHTRATDIAPHRVMTDRGTVRAAHIIRATEGFTCRLPGHRRDLLPLNSAIIITQPLPQALWDQIGWQGAELMGDAAHAYCYAQRTREGRIAMGGRGVPYRYASGIDPAGQAQPGTIRALRAILHRMLPQTRDLELDHVWCGTLGVPRDWCAGVGYDAATGLGWAGGYVGVGVASANLAGRTLADLVRGQDSALTALPWVNRRQTRWEPEPLRWLGVQGMYALYHMADRREARRGGVRSSRLAAWANRLTGH